MGLLEIIYLKAVKCVPHMTDFENIFKNPSFWQ